MSSMVRQGNVFARRGHYLVPVGPADVAAVRRIPEGKHVAVALHLERDPSALRRWRALLAETTPHTRWENADALSDIVKLMTGYSTPLQLPGDRIAFQPRSTSPAAEMDQIEFSEFLTRAEEFIAAHVLGGADLAELRRETNRYLAGEARDRLIGPSS